jgi:septal ring-binding cell division protein DamX
MAKSGTFLKATNNIKTSIHLFADDCVAKMRHLFRNSKQGSLGKTNSQLSTPSLEDRDSDQNDEEKKEQIFAEILQKRRMKVPFLSYVKRRGRPLLNVRTLLFVVSLFTVLLLIFIDLPLYKYDNIQIGNRIYSLRINRLSGEVTYLEGEKWKRPPIPGEDALGHKLPSGPSSASPVGDSSPPLVAKIDLPPPTQKASETPESKKVEGKSEKQIRIAKNSPIVSKERSFVSKAPSGDHFAPLTGDSSSPLVYKSDPSPMTQAASEPPKVMKTKEKAEKPIHIAKKTPTSVEEPSFSKFPSESSFVPLTSDSSKPVVSKPAHSLEIQTAKELPKAKKTEVKTKKSLTGKTVNELSNPPFYGIKIMSLRDEKTPMVFIEQQKKKGVHIHWRKATINGESWYQIFIGRFATKEEANRFLKEKKIPETYPGSMIIKITPTNSSSTA